MKPCEPEFLYEVQRNSLDRIFSELMLSDLRHHENSECPLCYKNLILGTLKKIPLKNNKNILKL